MVRAKLSERSLLIHLTLVSLIFANIQVIKAAAQVEPGDSLPESSRSKLVSIERDSDGNDLTTEKSDQESPNAINVSSAHELEEEEEENELLADDNQQSARKLFEWKYHQDDHAHYSGRSLMSAAGIDLHKNNPKSDVEDEDSDPVELGKREKKLGEAKSSQESLDPLETVDYAEREWQLMFRSLDLAFDSVSSSILQEIGKQTNIFEETLMRLKPRCRRDINHIRESVRKHKLWALRMLDSNGKLPSGITYGRFSSPGDYEECLGVQVDETIYRDVSKNIAEKFNFHGKYCLIDFRLPLPERPPNKLLSIHESVLNFTGTDIARLYPDFVANYSGYASVFYEVGYLHAFCLPSSCDINDVTRALSKAIEGTYITVNNTIDCEERPPNSSEPLRKSQVLSLFILIPIFLNALLASLAYYLLNRNNPEVGARNHSNDSQRLGMSHSPASTKSEARHNLWNYAANVTLRNRFYADTFSIQKNFERLSKPDPRGLNSVHYTRLVAMALTVITHTGAMGTLRAITKPADASNSEQMFRDLLPQMLANSFSSIQVFFFMAGFMLVISTFPSVVRDKGRISFLDYAIKRAIRLLPGLAATILLNFLWPLIVDGPMLKYFFRMIVAPCEENWWHTLGFMSNFDHVEKMCLRHSYFSASDYQLHIIAFPLLILLYKQPGLAMFISTLLIICGYVAQIIMTLTKTVLPFMMVDYIDKEALFNVIHYTHHPVWNHMSAFFYGFIIGYLVTKKIRVNLSQRTIKCLWYIMLPAGVIAMLAPYFWNHYKRPIYTWQMILYAMFDRTILLSTCAWVSYAGMVLCQPVNKSTSNSQKQNNQLSATNGPDNKEASAKLASLESYRNGQLDKPTIMITLDGHSKNLSANETFLGGLPRQRSSPNLPAIQEQQASSTETSSSPEIAHRRLSKAVSSSNLAATDHTGNSRQGKIVDSAGDGSSHSGQADRHHGTRGKRPVSNINTLFLILSRLTFQLYLFNMVVLWIDINQSKYLWYFSYYFIIIKGAAVYICSAILAMIFFVVLESPSSTLYIVWVKKRAAARFHTPEKSEINENIEKKVQSMDDKAEMRMSQPAILQNDSLGVCDGSSETTLRFIDLASSSPVAKSIRTDAERDGTFCRNNNHLDQTRM